VDFPLRKDRAFRVAVSPESAGHRRILPPAAATICAGALRLLAALRSEETPGTRQRFDRAGHRPKRFAIVAATVDSPRGLAGKRSGWWAAGLAGAVAVLVFCPTGMDWERFAQTWHITGGGNYHASSYTVIDWLTGQGTRIPALAGAAGSGLGLGLAWKRAEPAPRRHLLIGTAWRSGPAAIPGISPDCSAALLLTNPAWLLLTFCSSCLTMLIGYGILGRFKFDPFQQWLVYAPSIPC
jgi:hypothetical protein